MSDADSIVLFDHFLSEQLGFWLRHSPEVPLPLPVFYNLLSSSKVLCFDEHIFPDDIERGPWRDEFRHLTESGKLEVIARKFDVETEMEITHSVTRQLDIKPIGRFEDTLSLLWCAIHDIPLRLSDRASSHIGYSVERAGRFLETVVPPVDHEGASINACLKWVVDVEVPELERRSQSRRREAFEKGVLVVQSDPIMTKFLAQSFWESLEDSVFLTPAEIVGLYQREHQLKALREVMARASKLNFTEPDIRALLREQWDSLLGRMEIADLTFTGIDILLIPLQVPGPVTKPFQIAINRFIRSRQGWLLSLNTFNRQLRNSDTKKVGK
jgi:hypothetical protein